MENIVHLSLVLLNGGRNTRIPDFPSHKATATALSLVSPDLAVNSSLGTKNDPFGNGHLPVVNILNEKPDNLSPTEGQIPKYNCDRADWQQFQNSVLSYDFHSIVSKNITLKIFTLVSQKSY